MKKNHFLYLSLFSLLVLLFLMCLTNSASAETFEPKTLSVFPPNPIIIFDENPVSSNSDGSYPGNLSATVPMGTNRLLVVTVGTNDQTNTPTVQFGNQMMLLAKEDNDIINSNSSTYNARVFVYYLTLNSGIAITDNISITGLDDYYSIGGMSFQGINQTSPIKQAASASSPTGLENTSQVAATINGYTAGNLLFGFFGDDNMKQFDWEGPYHDNTHTNTGLDGDGYYYTSYATEAAADNPTFTYEINNSIQSCAGVLIEFAAAPSVEVNVTVNPISIKEVNSLSLDYLFTLSEAVAEDLTINFTISGSAEDDNDFTVGTPGINMELISYTPLVGTGNNSGTITIKAGQTSGVLRITPTADVLIELDEMVIVTIN